MRCGLVLGALAGCFHPSPPQGAACSTGGDCPSPLQCIAGFCSSGGSGIDAPGSGGGDAIQGDGAGMMIASNGVDPTFAAGGIDIAITSLATFNTDTGEITGAITRAA